MRPFMHMPSINIQHSDRCADEWVKGLPKHFYTLVYRSKFFETRDPRFLRCLFNPASFATYFVTQALVVVLEQKKGEIPKVKAAIWPFPRPPVYRPLWPFFSDPIFFLTDPSVAVDPPPSLSHWATGAEVLHLVGFSNPAMRFGYRSQSSKGRRNGN